MTTATEPTHGFNVSDLAESIAYYRKCAAREMKDAAATLIGMAGDPERLDTADAIITQVKRCGEDLVEHRTKVAAYDGALTYLKLLEAEGREPVDQVRRLDRAAQMEIKRVAQAETFAGGFGSQVRKGFALAEERAKVYAWSRIQEETGHILDKVAEGAGVRQD